MKKKMKNRVLTRPGLEVCQKYDLEIIPIKRGSRSDLRQERRLQFFHTNCGFQRLHKPKHLQTLIQYTTSFNKTSQSNSSTLN